MPEMQLSWQPGFSLLRKPEKRRAPRRNRRQRFEFVVEHPERVHRSRCPPSTAFTHSEPRFDISGEQCVIVGSHEACLGSEAVEQNGPLIDSAFNTFNDEPSNRGEEPPSPERIDETTILNLRNDEDQSAPWHSLEPMAEGGDLAGPGPSLEAVSTLPDLRSPPFSFVPSTVQYTSLLQRFKPILDRYNMEFCTIPLTFYLRINPFRYRTDLDPEPSFLVHAVMALSGHHVNSTSTLSHRHAALQLLRRSLGSFSDSEALYSVLDTIVILFSLDETQSMLGSWNTHLVGARVVIEACGGIKALAMSSRVEAQIGILTWWDAITGLLSREDCVFPYTYFDAVLSNQHKREWDFFGLCGCPTSLAKIVMQIARLSAEREKSSLTPGSTFDDTVISKIEQSLESWSHMPSAAAFQDEDDVHRNQDVMHCSEAWRNGLLLYIFRVFWWKPGSSVPARVFYLARVIVDHVVSCRNVDLISRQALLPLFFAGCELRDRSIQMEITRLCSVWDERTRYHMFSSTIPLLEEIWAEQEAKGFENVWWGQVVDKQNTFRHGLKIQLCFG